MSVTGVVSWGPKDIYIGACFRLRECSVHRSDIGIVRIPACSELKFSDRLPPKLKPMSVAVAKEAQPLYERTEEYDQPSHIHTANGPPANAVLERELRTPNGRLTTFRNCGKPIAHRPPPRGLG